MLVLVYLKLGSIGHIHMGSEAFDWPFDFAAGDDSVGVVE
jgi:hypothetical protein